MLSTIHEVLKKQLIKSRPNQGRYAIATNTTETTCTWYNSELTEYYNLRQP